ncbi:MAG: AbrB/MazE/SpoVT family DNA-binding domain-containing protein [Candidatus Woesebacteria bacterium]|jgi:AbrB family looped-hinge helix DNA binding protein
MNLLQISYTNCKGQLVIPKAFRDKLGINKNKALIINLQGNSILISPIEEVISKADQESSYLDVLKKTQGTWGKDDWSAQRKKKRQLELKASKTRKKQW